MGRKSERVDDEDRDVEIGRLIATLEQVTAALNATNERLSRIAGPVSGPAAGGDFASAVGRAELPAAFAGAAAAASDEGVLRSLAQANGLAAPMERLIGYRNSNLPQSRPRYWAIVNFNLHSANRRLFVFDVAGETVTGYFCAHGKGSEGASDDGFANVFSNQDGSNASSLGIYRCAETYDGDHGYSMRLDGLESSNSHARHRAIVVHGADYVSQQFIQQTGRIGRSKGCPAVEQQHVGTVIDALKAGSLLLAWKS